jgi:hypothetical protein
VLKKKPINYLKLCPEIKRGVFWGSLISIAHIAIYCFVRYHWNQQLTINFNIPFQTYWNKILVAGFVEEIMFRGLVLQNLNKVFSFKTSNIASATLFLLAHVPYWYFGNQFSLPLSTIMYDFGFILAFGLLQGFLLKKTNSLWTCIIHHSVNNALALIVR